MITETTKFNKWQQALGFASCARASEMVGDTVYRQDLRREEYQTEFAKAK